jgi:hypothetical protein
MSLHQKVGMAYGYGWWLSKNTKIWKVDIINPSCSRILVDILRSIFSYLRLTFLPRDFSRLIHSLSDTIPSQISFLYSNIFRNHLLFGSDREYSSVFSIFILSIIT